MDRFDKTLRDHIYRNNIKILSLSKASGVDRTLIQKMIKGDRIPADKEILEKLIEFLMLTPRQAKQLREAYHIARIGEDTYARHLLVKDMLEKFCHETNISDVFFTTKYKHSFMNTTGNGVFYGSKDINQLLKAVLETEASHNGIIKMLIQPTYDFIIELLAIMGSEYPIQINHIFCLQEQGNKEEHTIYNLNCIKNIAPLLTTGCEYTPHIYYEDIPSHINSASLFPYLIITSSQVVTLSSDLNNAILYQNASFLTLFTSIFKSIKTNTFPLVNKIKPLIGTYKHYNYVISEPNTDTSSLGFNYSLYSQPCLSLFSNITLAKKYITDTQLSEQLLSKYDKLSSRLFHPEDSGSPFTSYFTLEGIEYFWRYGRFLELPNNLYSPFEKKDCLYILNNLYEKCISEKITCYLINKEVFKLPSNLIISASGENNVSIIYTHPDKDTMHYNIKEKSIATSLYSYLEFLKHSNAVYSIETTLEQLKRQIDIYTQELRGLDINLEG